MATSALLVSAPVAAAESPKPEALRWLPAPDGAVGAALVAGPFTQPNAALLVKELALGVRPVKGGAPFRLLAAQDGRVPLPTAERGNVVLGWQLVASARTRVLALLAVDGSMTVQLGGVQLVERAGPRNSRDSWEPVLLELPAGLTTLLVTSDAKPSDQRAALRLLDPDTLLPPSNVQVLFPGAANERAALLRTQLRVGLELVLGADGYAASVRLDAPAGAPFAPEFAAALELSSNGPGGPDARHALGAPLAQETAFFPLRAQLPRITPAMLVHDRRLTLRVELGPRGSAAVVQLSRADVLPADAPTLAARVERWLSTAHPPLRDAAVVEQTLKAQLTDLESARGATLPALAAARLRQLLTTLERGADPLLAAGRLEVELPPTQTLGGERVLLHVPVGAAAVGKTFPAVVALHGLDGNGRDVVEKLLDALGDGPVVDGFIIAPDAYGNSFYRGVGEQAVLRALDFALARYPIDPARVAITGVSMGGTGAAELALKHPDRFAAVAPLCGYHSYFVRRDTQHKPIREWERALMHRWSPASFAEMGRSLRFHIAHGTLDEPIDNATSLIRALTLAGNAPVEEWPEVGHDVHRVSWEKAKLWPWLVGFRRREPLAHVTVQALDLAHARHGWAKITGLQSRELLARLDARVTDRDEIAVVAERLTSFELDRPLPLVDGDDTLTVELEGVPHRFAKTEPVALHREGDRWAKGAPAARDGAKRAGVEGPFSALFDGPLVVVFGAQRAGTARALSELARYFATGRPRHHAQFATLDDGKADAQSLQDRNVLLLGSEQENRWVRPLLGEPQVRFAANSVRFYDRSFVGSELGALLVRPRADDPKRLVAWLVAGDVAGYYRATSLPRLLPDFVVWDAQLAPAANAPILGRANVLAAGFFDELWRLPDRVSDTPSGGASAEPDELPTPSASPMVVTPGDPSLGVAAPLGSQAPGASGTTEASPPTPSVAPAVPVSATKPPPRAPAPSSTR